MRTTGCGGGARPARHPPGPCPGPPAPSGRPLRHCRGGAGETRAPQKCFLRSKLKSPLRATVCPTRAWGTLPARPPPPTRMPRGHTGLLKAVRSHVTFVGLMQGRGYGGTALATKPRPGGGLPHIPRAAPHTQVPSWPWPQWPARERHLSAHTPSTAPARLGARPGCQGEPPAPVPAPSAGQEDTGRVRGQHPLRGSPTPAGPVTPITRSGL